MKTLTLALITVLSFSTSKVFADEAKPAAAASAPEPAAPADSGSAKKSTKAFTGEAKKVEDYLTNLFDQSRKTTAPGAEGNAARAAIGNAMNWERIAQDCLGKARYKSTGEKNRNEFRNLLKEVVEKTAYSRLSSFWKGGTTYSFKTIDVKGNDAHVVSDFNLNGDISTLDYFLEKRGNDWRVYDIAYENLRYSKNINEQLEAFLKEKGFPNLLTQLRKRLAELNDATSKSR